MKHYQAVYEIDVWAESPELAAHEVVDIITGPDDETTFTFTITECSDPTHH